MELKYHAEVSNLKEAVAFYSKLFDGKIIKNGESGGHAYIKLFDQISFMINKEEKTIEKAGEIVIKFSEAESHLMDELMARVKENKDCKIREDIRYFPWGTEIFTFKDKYGYKWALERVA